MQNVPNGVEMWLQVAGQIFPNGRQKPVVLPGTRPGIIRGFPGGSGGGRRPPPGEGMEAGGLPEQPAPSPAKHARLPRSKSQARSPDPASSQNTEPEITRSALASTSARSARGAAKRGHGREQAKPLLSPPRHARARARARAVGAPPRARMSFLQKQDTITSTPTARKPHVEEERRRRRPGTSARRDESSTSSRNVHSISCQLALLPEPPRNLTSLRLPDALLFITAT